MDNSQVIPNNYVSTPEELRRASATALSDRDSRWVIGIVLATVSYQAFLCLLNTHGLHASRTLLGLAEGCILMACVPLMLRRVLPGVTVLVTIAGSMFCVLSLVKGELDIKTIRDLTIPLCYFWVGCNLGRPELVNRALVFTIWIVLVMGLLELLFLDQYTNFFDIYSYYVNTGTLEPITNYVNTSKLQLNGTRPEGIGRTLLPNLLGSHRVSSVFLEPVSLGNFATICAAWGLSKDKSEMREILFFLGMAAFMIIISDSRFAITSVGLMIIMRVLLTGRALYLPILAPFAAVLLLVLIGGSERELTEDSFRGRLALSGYALHQFDIPTLLASAVASPYADMGYAHLISSFGLPLTLMLWFSLWMLPIPTVRGQRFRAFVAIYITFILCVSGYSLYALKTSGVVWLLMGCLLLNPAPRKRQPESLNPGG